MDKVYNPKPVEERWYRFWMEKGFFHADVHSKKKPYTIVIPPPNVTGSLHTGHALNNTLQDILIRQKRMAGFEAEWLPGMDHAGIATQNVVEKALAKEGLTRHDLGRDEFVKRAWEWKEKYGGEIIDQLKRLGCSLDWQRERFTFDEGYKKAVLQTFVKYYQKRLIYRGEYIVNWCPRCESAISDLEVQHKDHSGFLYTIKYPLVGQVSRLSILVATTRPETMLGDTAVAVHPKDKRYKSLVGKKVRLPLVRREIPIIADELVDPEFGTGAVKVTPAHDPIDFEIRERHHLESVKVINEKGEMTLEAKGYEGLTREECREKILQDLEEQGLLERKEEYTHSLGLCDRCDTIIEPLISTQWFVRMKDLARPAIEVVKEGKVRFIPQRWTKVYLDWMENIRDWCISRQLWWGHRIPAWWCIQCNEGKYIKSETFIGAGPSRVEPRYYFSPEAEPIVSIDKPDHCPMCEGIEIIQDDNVLDTWFSSALWPFSTFGWPEKTEDLEQFYPTDVLLTAPEIINLWVARMIFSGLEFMEEIPFSDVYLHATVLNAEGRRMSKSSETGMDPVNLMEKFGTDALRFTLTSLESQGQSFRFWENRCEMGRNFCNKIWNAARFLLMNQNDPSSRITPESSSGSGTKYELADRWILSRYHRTIQSTTHALESYQFHEMAKGLYEFFWHDFCDWYLELVKPRIPKHALNQAQGRIMDPALGIALSILEGTLRLLHPVMPFITEEIWQMTPHKGKSIMVASWPEADPKFIDEEVEKRMGLLMDIITSIRNIRSEMNIPPKKETDCLLRTKGDGIVNFLNENEGVVKTLAKVNRLSVGTNLEKPKASASAVLSGVELFLPLEGVIDFEVERGRIEKESQKISFELDRLKQKLGSSDFLTKAPEEVVESTRMKREEFETKLQTLKGHLKSLQEV